MKRSEMVEFLSDFLDDYVTQDAGYAWRHSKENAESLLNQIEGEGMLPPFCEKLYNPHTDLNTGNEWELEE